MTTNDERSPSLLPLETEDMFDALLSRSEKEPVILFKHSRACGVSSLAYRRITKLVAPEDPPVYLLTVQKARSLSRHVANYFDIRHESPQIIVVYKKQPVYHTSHSMISVDSIREASASAQL